MADQITANPNAPRDWTGDIVPGSLLYTYVTGTTTPLTVFRDVDATLPHPNPIEADANGVFPQMFFTGVVKGVATDPDGVVLPGFPLDPMPRSVVGTSGASTISFLPTAEIPESDVQGAIERVQGSLEKAVGTGVGFLAINSDGEGSRRTIIGTANQIAVTQGEGDGGDPTIAAVIASEAEAQAGTDATKLMTAQRTRQAFNAGGAAPVYAARAWVNFDGTGTPSIRASGNVASITDNGAGDYTVNFTTPMPDANYCAQITVGGTAGGGYAVIHPTVAPTASAIRFLTRTDSGGTEQDAAQIHVVVFR